MRIEFTAIAEHELDEAASYYDQQRTGLGREFALEVSRALDRILEYPHAWQRLEHGVRRCQLNRFPYGVVYSVEDDTVVVVAVMYLRRKPDYWRDRLKNLKQS